MWRRRAAGSSPAMRRIALLCLGAVACAAATAGPASAQVQPAGTGEPALHELRAEHAVVRVARDAGRRRVPGPVRLLREQHAQGLARRSTRPRELRLELGELERCGDAPARRPVRRLRAGSVLVPERLAVLLRTARTRARWARCSGGARTRRSTAPSRRPPLALAAGADFVKDTKVPVRIDFADDVAGPFPANFLCFQVGGGPQNLCDKNAGSIYGHNPACSVPGSAGKSTTFTCTADYGADRRTGTCGPA